MKFFNKTFLATAVVTSLVLPTAAFATNGMNAEGSGVKSRGMGGAGVALATETGSITNNPAAIIGVGNRLDVALGIFSPSPRSYTLTGNTAAPGSLDTTQESGTNYFAIPFFGMTFPINAKSSWSVGINGNGGMNTDYGKNVFPTFPPNATEGTGIDLAQVFLTATYGHKVGNVDLGITAIYAYQTFEATGLQAFDNANFSGNAGSVTSNGKDNSDGFGIKIGILSQVTPAISLGASYQPKIEMGKFDKYKGLLSDQGQLDIAATLTLGIAWKANPKTTIAFDYHNIDYKDVNAIGNSGTKLVPTVVRFGDTNGPGFGWNSIDVFKLGVDYKYSKNWSYRTGWNHGDNPISSAEVTTNFLAPGVIEDHLTLGFTNVIDPKSEWSMNFVHSFKNSVSGKFGPTLSSFGGGTMTIEMEQNFLELGYSRLF